MHDFQRYLSRAKAEKGNEVHCQKCHGATANGVHKGAKSVRCHRTQLRDCTDNEQQKRIYIFNDVLILIIWYIQSMFILCVTILILHK